MQKRYTLFGVLLIAGGAWYFVATHSTGVDQSPVIVEQPGLAPESSNAQKEGIVVDTPIPESTVRSPLIVTGKARGNWFFEGSFPVTLTDAAGNVLVAHYATAQGEWMTSGFVPFRAELTFNTAGLAGQVGYITLKKDNPSGDPAFDDSLTMRIRF